MGGSVSHMLGGELGNARSYVLGGLGVFAVVGLGRFVFKRQMKRLRLAGERDRSTLTNNDMVYLMIPPRLGVVSSISPFAIKLETWFRMMDIPHEVVETTLGSSKKQFPYVILNGEQIPDTNFIVDRLSRHFGKPVDSTLSILEKSISTAYRRMLEENTLYTYAWYRVLHQSAEFWSQFRIGENTGTLARKMLKYAPSRMKLVGKIKFWQQGMGRHNPEEIFAIAETDLRAVSTYLADKDYFMGKEPTMIDCVLFGHLVQVLWININFPPRFVISRECKNLVRYLDRMKDRFYPDWDELCRPSLKA